ncbi:MAG: exosortase A [Sphingomonadaceae bacterium]
MQPDAALQQTEPSTWQDRVPAAWRQPLLRLALLWAALLALTAQDWAAMVRLWWDVSTYNHILFVPVIIGWLVWHRRGELARLTPSPWWPALVPLAGALLLWLVARLGGLDIGSQLGAVLAMEMALVAVLGPRVGYALLFPLAYALFLVPFGDELVPALQMITAKMTIALTLWSGVPAVVDGVFIDTPAGLFEVAEECSGVKFLIAMIALGVLVAQCCFTSWKRRAAFMAAAVALPILANGVRAWGTVFIAQLRGIEFAVGFDHIVYGWVFFGIVIMVLLGVAWRWFDRDPDAPQIDGRAILASPLLAALERNAMSARRVVVLGFGLVLAAGAWQAAAARQSAALPDQLMAPAIPGWQAVPLDKQLHWEPRAGGADRRLLMQFADENGERVEVFFALYASQNDRADATGFGEGVLPPDTDWRWLAPVPAPAGMTGDALFAQGSIKRVAYTQWRSGDLSTASSMALKLAVMRDRTLMRARPVATLIVSAEGDDTDAIAARLARFTAAMGDRDAWMDRAAGLR